MLSSNQAARKWLQSKNRSAGKWLACSVILGSAGGLLTVLQAYCIAAIIHGVFMDDRPLSDMGTLFATLAAVVLFKAGIAWGREQAGFAAGTAVRRQVRREILTGLYELGPVAAGHIPTGRWVSTVMEQVEALQAYFARYIPQLFLAVMVPLMIAACVFRLSWAAGGILLLTAPLIPLFMVLVGMGAESISQRHFQALARMSAYFLDTLQGLTTLKIFDRSKAEADHVARVSSVYRRKTMAVLRMAFLSSAVLEFFSAISLAITAVYLGLGYLGYFDFGTYGHKLTFQQGFFILLLAPEFYHPLKELGTHYHARASAVGAAEEILAVLDLKEGGPSHARRGSLHLSEEKELVVELDDVSCDFGNTRPVLHRINLRIAQGERVALVGSSGAGKSTLLHLLLGFVQPVAGVIRINGMPLADLSLSEWRQRLAWIGQHPVLFPGSIVENIRLARPDADDGAVFKAAEAAGVLSFCDRLPQGIDTALGEQGWGLSKGQAQRVALARAYLKGAPLLLLDEPTAGLDQAAEHQLIDNAMALFQDRTVLMVTHSAAALTGMDRVIHLERGRMRELTGSARDMFSLGSNLAMVHSCEGP